MAHHKSCLQKCKCSKGPQTLLGSELEAAHVQEGLLLGFFTAHQAEAGCLLCLCPERLTGQQHHAPVPLAGLPL